MESYGKSIPGSSGVNADVFFISSDSNVFVISDGASGAFDKVEASKCCIKPFETLSYDNSKMSPEDYVFRTIKDANTNLVELSQKQGYLSFATLTVCVLDNNCLITSAVGDTPAFLLRDSIVKRIIKPRRKYAPLVEYSMISEEEAERLVQSLPDIMWSIFENYLPMVIPEIATTKHTIDKGDVLIICSDGISDIVKHEEFSKFIKDSKSLECAGNGILDEVILKCKDKYRDDATLILIRF